jgi:hypothetical protein
VFVVVAGGEVGGEALLSTVGLLIVFMEGLQGVFLEEVVVDLLFGPAVVCVCVFSLLVVAVPVVEGLAEAEAEDGTGVDDFLVGVCVCVCLCVGVFVGEKDDTHHG